MSHNLTLFNRRSFWGIATIKGMLGQTNKMSDQLHLTIALNVQPFSLSIILCITLFPLMQAATDASPLAKSSVKKNVTPAQAADDWLKSAQSEISTLTTNDFKTKVCLFKTEAW